MNAHSHVKRSPSRLMWIDEIPEDWDQIRGKRVFRQVRTPKKPDDEQLSATQKYGVVPQNRFMEQEGSRVVLALSGIDNFRHVDKDDFVISLRSFQGGIERCHYDGCVSPAYTILKKNRDISEDFFGYLLKCDWFVAALQVGITGIREGKNVSYEEFGDIILPFPKVQEQTAIAGFLDRETGLIDGLIEKKTRFIALLKEKRAAEIVRCVTKGFNEDVPMKSSGEAWIGDVPSHWQLMPLRAFFAFRNEKNDPVKTENILSLSIAHGVTPYSEEGRGGNKSKDDLTAYKIAREGDIVLNSMNVIVGAVGRSKYFGAISPVYYALYPQRPDVHVPFFEKIFMNSGFQKSLLRFGKGILMKISGTGQMNTIRMKISQDDLKTVVFPVPPAEEQRAIADFLDAEIKKIDGLITLTERSIDLLREKRAALITAAVTGKIDVRAAA